MNILFVCTGNTCRSPMAEALFKDRIKEYLDYCNVSSCGLSAMPGDCASKNAIEAMKERNIDISSHRSRQINKYIIDESDFIICMSDSHYKALLPIAPDKLIHLDISIPDPYGCDIEEYKKCASMISDNLDALLNSETFFTTEKMTDGDIDAVAAIEEECFSEPWSKASFQSQIKKDYSVCYVEKYLGKTIGYICADNIIGEVYIGNVAVEEKYRKHHAGKRLVQKLVDFCIENKSEILTLEVRVSNVPALNLYSKFGFEVVGKRKDFYKKPTEDGYIMTKFFGGDIK